DTGRGDLLSFPTRRSSDLGAVCAASTVRLRGKSAAAATTAAGFFITCPAVAVYYTATSANQRRFSETPFLPTRLRENVHFATNRSEEHTSELQSQSNLVCR